MTLLAVIWYYPTFFLFFAFVVYSLVLVFAGKIWPMARRSGWFTQPVPNHGPIAGLIKKSKYLNCSYLSRRPDSCGRHRLYPLYIHHQWADATKSRALTPALQCHQVSAGLCPSNASSLNCLSCLSCRSNIFDLPKPIKNPSNLPLIFGKTVDLQLQQIIEYVLRDFMLPWLGWVLVPFLEGPRLCLESLFIDTWSPSPSSSTMWCARICGMPYRRYTSVPPKWMQPRS